MKRSDALKYIRIAGHNGDQKSFMRLYCENRISYTAALQAYREGEKTRKPENNNG